VIDFDKPIRFTDDKTQAHFIGPRLDGRLVVERPGHPGLIIVDSDGRERSVSTVAPIIENIPKRITRWILMLPESGYENKEDALAAANMIQMSCPAVVRVEFEEGELP